MDAGVGRLPITSSSLGQALRSRVELLHVQAEQSGIIADILKGRAGLPAYTLLLRNLLPAYEALEHALQRRRDTRLLAPLARPELYRVASIEADLDSLLPSWRTTVPPLPESIAYAASVTASAEGDGQRLIAHAYARYAGDLNGGTIMSKLIARQHPSISLSFHDFPGIRDIVHYRASFRAAIDLAGAAIADWQPVLEEAAAAFRHNIEISFALQKRTERM